MNDRACLHSAVQPMRLTASNSQRETLHTIQPRKTNESVMGFYQVPYFILMGNRVNFSLEFCPLLKQTQGVAAIRTMLSILFLNPHKFFMHCLRYCLQFASA